MLLNIQLDTIYSSSKRVTTKHLRLLILQSIIHLLLLMYATNLFF